jgi:hypothetical protein
MKNSFPKIYLIVLFLILCINSLFGKIQFQIVGGIVTGNFKDINESNKIWSGSGKSYELDNGFNGGFSLDYDLNPKFGISFDSSINYFNSNETLEFIDETNISLGKKDFPIWKVYSIPMSFSGYLLKNIGSLKAKLGLGLGFVWAQYSELFLHYNADWFDDAKYYFTGTAPLFQIESQLEYKISQKLSLILTPRYQYSKIRELELSSKDIGGERGVEDNLYNENQDKIELDLSGFSITIGVGF